MEKINRVKLPHLKLPANELMEMAGMRYREGNYEQAAFLYQRVIEQRDPETMPYAMHNLANMLRQGQTGRLENSQPDYEQAAFLYQRVIEQRDPETMLRAMNNLANMLRRGQIGRLENGQPDYAQAADLYQQAIIRGNEIGNTTVVNIAQQNLNRLNQQIRQQTAQNFAGAISWFSQNQSISRGGRG